MRRISWYIIALYWVLLSLTVLATASPVRCGNHTIYSLTNIGKNAEKPSFGNLDKPLSRVAPTSSEDAEDNNPRVLPTRPSANSTSIGAIKFLPDGAEVSISQKIVTYVQEDKLYVQEMDRSSAIRAASPGFPIMVSPGDVVSFSGTLRTVDMEREILFDGSIVVHLSDVPLPDALGMNERVLVGGPLNAFTPGIPGCPGINTVGLRTQIWGRATSELFVDETGDWCFYFDDGSNIYDGTMRGNPAEKTKGVRVYSYMPPTVGDFKIVRGVCGITMRQPVPPETQYQPIRVIRTNSHYDIFDPGTASIPVGTDNISGTVRLVGAVKPQQARVYSTNTSVLLSSVSDTAKPFSLPKVPTDGILVTASAPGFYSESKVVEGGESDVEFELQPAPKYIHLWSNTHSLQVCNSNTATITALLRDKEGKGLAGNSIKLTTTTGVFVESGNKEIILTTDDVGFVETRLSSSGAGIGLAQLVASNYPNPTVSATATVAFLGASVSCSASKILIQANEASIISSLVTMEDTPTPGANVTFTTDFGGFDEASGAATFMTTSDLDGIASVTLRLPGEGTANVLARYTDVCGNECLAWTAVAVCSTPWQSVGVQFSSPLVDQLLGSQDGSRQVAVVTSAKNLVVWDADGTTVWQQSVGGSNNTPACANLDADPAGELEIAVPAEDFGRMYVFSAVTGLPTAGWPTVTKWPFKSVAATIADVNVDGALEVLGGDQSCYVIAWNSTGDWKGNGNDNESFLWRNLTGTIGTAILGSTVSVGDITGNGIPEAIVGASQAPDMYCFPGNAWGEHANPPSAPPIYSPGWPKGTSGRIESSSAIGDIDGDGINDIAVGCDGSSIYFYLSSTGTWQGHPLGGLVKSSPALADLDGDGLLDVVVGCNDGRVYAMNYLGQHLAGWEGGILLSEDAKPVKSSPVIGDINGDGTLEVVIGCSNGFVYAIHSDGINHKNGQNHTTGPFAWVKCAIPPGKETAEVLSTPVIDDLDGDGKVDIVAASTEGVYKFATGHDLVRDDAHLPWPTFHRDNARSGHLGSRPTPIYSSIVGCVTKNGQPVLRAKVYIMFEDGTEVPVPHSTPVQYRNYVLTVGDALQNQSNKGNYSINQLETGREYKLRVESNGNPDKIVGPFTAAPGLNRVDISLTP